MQIRCPLATQNLAAETPGTLKICCEMQDIRSETTGEIITRKTHTALEAFHSPEFNKIRKNLNNGVRDPHCTKCWQAEDQGTMSRRMIELQTVGYDPEIDLKYMTVSLGNTCNIKCRTCGVRDSTSWLKEHWELNTAREISFKNFRDQHTVDFKQDQHFYQTFLDQTLYDLRDLSFLGGEPLMIPEFWNILEQIVEKNLQEQITLNINTNCTIWETRREDMLSRFKNVNLFCSIDGIAEVFEYMRHPAKWNIVERNLNSMLLWKRGSPGRSMTVMPAVSAINVWHIDQVSTYAQQHQLQVYYRPVVTPDYLDIVNIPNSVKELLKDRMPDSHLKTHLFSKNPDPEKWQEFLDSIRRHDQYRNESFVHTFEEYAKVLKFEG